MKEFKIGEEIRIRCVKSNTPECCANCVFNLYAGGNCGTVACDSSEREDKKYVYFELVKED